MLASALQLLLGVLLKLQYQSIGRRFKILDIKYYSQLTYQFIYAQAQNGSNITQKISTCNSYLENKDYSNV